MLNVRKTVSQFEGDVEVQYGKMHQIIHLLLPPFVIYLAAWSWDILKSSAKNVWGKIWKQGLVDGQSSKQFHRRRYQPHLQSIRLQSEQLGFTNQVLVQGGRKSINYYLPVYITNKIKSIQDVSVQSLTGNISCAIIINVFHQGIPTQIVDRLESSMIVQLNRGQAIKLEDDGITITVKRDKKKHFLIFTIRKVFLAFLLSDPLWSPFELIELVISITLNTVTIKQHSLQKQYQNSIYNPQMEYKISFNCMRNSDQIPVSYALDCVFGIYDLAERKLDVYSSNKGSYSEIMKSYEEYQAKQLRKKRGCPNASPKEIKAKVEEEQRAAVGLMGMLAQSIMGRLSLRPSLGLKKKAEKKVKYFQYSHFIIPLYKYPGNSLATIFIPVFLLALVSLAIFFQQPQLASRIGAITTMVLGYIALIPSIKEQLPPSSKLTVIEAVVYIETLCCLLCLFESFQIGGDESYVFVWHSNLTYLTCLIIHFGTFFFILLVYAMHKLVWEPDYNSDQKVIEVKPSDARESWDNPFCDEVFIKFNKEIMGGKYTEKQKQEMLIRPLLKPQMQLSKLPTENNINLFQQLFNLPDTSRKDIIPNQQPEQFQSPNAELYFSRTTSNSKKFSEI